MRPTTTHIVAAIVGAVVLSAPAVAVEKIHAAGQVTRGLTNEATNTAGQVINDTQNLGTPESTTSSTVGVEPGSGRG